MGNVCKERMSYVGLGLMLVTYVGTCFRKYVVIKACLGRFDVKNAGKVRWFIGWIHSNSVESFEEGLEAVSELLRIWQCYGQTGNH